MTSVAILWSLKKLVRKMVRVVEGITRAAKLKIYLILN